MLTADEPLAADARTFLRDRLDLFAELLSIEEALDAKLAQIEAARQRVQTVRAGVLAQLSALAGAETTTPDTTVH